ncbi:MAG: methionine adenosyltransferase [Candidatus Marsarchaeota archaeon]|nr:methionine adenosyltransferase [Candidatus Marsarchaeota archaeon]MCL5413172.1 methionine adenosyltransferase [Candidatus Marsarchaeota archaeon]
MRNISVNRLNGLPVKDLKIEYVERKGIGHPDSLIDGIVDETSHALCREYLDRCDNTILHHNVDKGLIIGGASNASFGRGKITRKIEVIVTGRATDRYKGVKIDVNDIAREVATKYLKAHTRFLDTKNEVKFVSKIARGSADLTDVFIRNAAHDDVPLANDTSFGLGFAPFSDTERLVLETERYLNSRRYKEAMPAVGEDIKVMGLRDGKEITLTIAVAFVSKLVKNLDHYISYKEKIRKDVARFASRLIEKDVAVYINAADPEDSDAVYLTKSGLSCEAGDDGSVGRGNRVNGLITPFRPMSLEAAAGKNPVNHIGKIYNLLATEVASDIVKQYPGIVECNIAIMSQIGQRIDQPLNLNINLATAKPADFENAKAKARYIADGWLENLGEFTMDISLGKHKTF